MGKSNYDFNNRLREMKEIAISRGGRCLSDHIKHGRDKLVFICQEGHVFKKRLDWVKSGTWCRICANKKSGLKRQKYSIVTGHEIAKRNGGKCLSKTYLGYTKKHLWQCSKGHVWYSEFRNVHAMGSWCPYCAGNRKHNVASINKKINKRGLRVHDLEYKADEERTYGLWECSLGHIWVTRVDTIVQRGDGCPYCNTSVGEKLCREIIETAFGKSFTKQRPDWLYSDKNHKLELDGFNSDLGIAFEYNGRQHMEPNLFNKGQLERRIDLDKQKNGLCISNEVVLVTVEEYDEISNIDDCITATREAFFKQGVNLPDVSAKKLDLDELRFPTENALFMKEVKDLVKRKGGILVTKHFIGKGKRYHIRCSEGHDLYKKLPSLRSSSWCRECDRIKYHQEMVQYAKDKNGVCLSDKYTQSQVKMDFKCQHGHVFKMSRHGMNHAYWCPTCGKRKASPTSTEFSISLSVK